MTSASNTTRETQYNKEQFHKTLKVLNQIVDYLEKFEDHHDKKFNFSKLAQLLNIPISEIDEIIVLLLNFQDIFENVFKKYRLQKYRAGNQVYLITEKRYSNESTHPPENIIFSSSHLHLLNDIIYVFKYVKRGKGFDIIKNGSELLTKVKELRDNHPYLFESRGNGVIYPSQFGLRLGELIISYNKSNRKLVKITLDNHLIEVKDDK